MATLAEVEQHRTAVESVSTLAVAELASQWADLPDTPLALAGPLAELLVELYGDFSPLAATIAADFYEDLRDQASVPGSYTAVLAPEASVDQIQASASWASSGAWLDDQKALRDAAGSLDRAITTRDRETISLNVGRDPAAPRYARHASANACAFCAMNAARGPVFRSSDAAATKYHDFCACTAVPAWRPSDYQEAPYVADWRQAYYDATQSVGTASTKAVLAHMRANAGLR